MISCIIPPMLIVPILSLISTSILCEGRRKKIIVGRCMCLSMCLSMCVCVLMCMCLCACVFIFTENLDIKFVHKLSNFSSRIVDVSMYQRYSNYYC